MVTTGTTETDLLPVRELARTLLPLLSPALATSRRPDLAPRCEEKHRLTPQQASLPKSPVEQEEISEA
jgi:hypothetical protein